jgi:hypothetical protein
MYDVKSEQLYENDSEESLNKMLDVLEETLNKIASETEKSTNKIEESASFENASSRPIIEKLNENNAPHPESIEKTYQILNQWKTLRRFLIIWRYLYFTI